MAKDAQIVQINGNQYDALTGQVVGSVKKLAKKAYSPGLRANIDGFVKSTKNSSRAATNRVSGIKQAQAVHAGTQRTKTLVRNAVKKPSRVLKSGSVFPKTQSTTPPVSSDRLFRASRVSKNAKVSRFGFTNLARSQNRSAATKSQPKLDLKTASQSSVPAQIRTMPSMVTSVSHQHLERLLDHALTNATAHKQSLAAQNRQGWHKVNVVPRWISVSVLLFVGLLVAGFFTWQNVPQVAVKLASVKSSVSASVPGYSPSGFGFEGPLQFDENSVTMKFKSNADPARNYEIVQKTSDWNSASLLANYLEPNSSAYQTSKVKGSTIYIFGEQSHATWVNNGTWYLIRDNAKLNSDQILKIAESL
ncbi:hypothetical protein A2884_02325 [Candidatus Saccharibacteria bacterium RIFCSPHIGHO2_01_FULL_48_12]|nr:MAG: hypothetical protein A2884_02325 [Candidatus Saccharibacteria bacterium RIFCSPHIGHO2_01_FULL_48_12]OGL36118.1 MAG: hypothetical protein A3F38_02755 [Candidatus Saccharibacteria bacterium RIFCSPHIGHO2_12_FULL_48_21]